MRALRIKIKDSLAGIRTRANWVKTSHPNQLDHKGGKDNNTSGGTRTRNLQIRSLSPYPLGHGGG